MMKQAYRVVAALTLQGISQILLEWLTHSNKGTGGFVEKSEFLTGF
jgi:hypothetical protein